MVVAPNTALRLRAELDFKGDNDHVYIAGDEWLFEGPGKVLLMSKAMKTSVIIQLHYIEGVQRTIFIGFAQLFASFLAR